ncbi:hypothetical protein Pelo_1130 [Pelomyxa schiedti]|nr:hypothetical protein Pelo_1130 [Pelomyxa schiedti]
MSACGELPAPVEKLIEKLMKSPVSNEELELYLRTDGDWDRADEEAISGRLADFETSLRGLGYSFPDQWSLLVSARPQLVIVSPATEEEANHEADGGCSENCLRCQRRVCNCVAVECGVVLADACRSSWFDVASKLEPFVPKLLSIACGDEGRDDVQRRAIGAIKICMEACGSLLVPHVKAVDRLLGLDMYRKFPSEGLLTSVVHMATVLPEWCLDVCESFVSNLVVVSNPKVLMRKIRWFDNWDWIPAKSGRQVVDFIQEKQVTVDLIGTLLDQWSIIEMHKEDLSKFLSTLSIMCSVEKAKAHDAILKFVDNELETQPLAALLLLPVVVSGGTVNQQLIVRALKTAMDGNPLISDSLFSVKQVFANLSLSSVRELFQVALAQHAQGHSGPIISMLRICPLAVKEFPEFVTLVEDNSRAAKTYIKQLNSTPCFTYEVGLTRKTYQFTPMDEDPEEYNKYGFCERVVPVAYTICITKRTLETGMIRLLIGLVASISSITPERTLVQVISSVELKVGLIRSFLLGMPLDVGLVSMVVKKWWSDIEEFSQSVFAQGITANDEEKLMPLMKIVLELELQPRAGGNPKWLPPSIGPSINTTTPLAPSQMQHLHTVLSQLLTAGDNDGVAAILALSGVEQSEFKIPDRAGRGLTLMEWAVNHDNFMLCRMLLPFCDTGRLPHTVSVIALDDGMRGLANLLWCHGFVIPQSVKQLRIHNTNMADASHPSFCHLFRPATWDVQRHYLFPWWFKVHILKTVILCWLHNKKLAESTSNTTEPQPTPSFLTKVISWVWKQQQPQQFHPIGRISRYAINHILTFLSPVHWF